MTMLEMEMKLLLVNTGAEDGVEIGVGEEVGAVVGGLATKFR
jgi:hypothetical protein